MSVRSMSVHLCASERQTTGGPHIRHIKSHCIPTDLRTFCNNCEFVYVFSPRIVYKEKLINEKNRGCSSMGSIKRNRTNIQMEHIPQFRSSIAMMEILYRIPERNRSANHRWIVCLFSDRNDCQIYPLAATSHIHSLNWQVPERFISKRKHAQFSIRE